MNLQEFVRLRHRFEWGGSGLFDPEGRMLNDCHTICASWATQLLGYDPIASYRGTYTDAAGARAILRRAGGSVKLFSAQLKGTGFRRVRDPRPGDIGIVEAPAGLDDFSEIGAIRFGPTWAVLGPGGLIAKPLQAVACWRFDP